MHLNLRVCKKYAGLPLLATVTVFAVLASTIQTFAQQTVAPEVSSGGTTQVSVKRIAIQHIGVIPANSGQKNYAAYCAACHGATGKGDGLAATALKQKPTDLTLLAVRNNGKFPWPSVRYVLTVVEDRSSYASKDMPNWCRAFHALDPGSQVMGRVRANNLVSYLQTLQIPAR